MKQATSEFQVDNGTVHDGQVLPDEHPAVVRFPSNFRDVTGETDPDVLDGEAVADMSSGETVGKTGEETDPSAGGETPKDGEKTDTGKHAETPKK